VCYNIKVATPRIDGNHAEFISVRQLLTELLLSFPLCRKGQKISRISFGLQIHTYKKNQTIFFLQVSALASKSGGTKNYNYLI
jgi:hypothetical protein